MIQMAMADEACDAKAAEKKLAGVVKPRFLKKCERKARAEAAKKGCGAKVVAPLEVNNHDDETA